MKNVVVFHWNHRRRALELRWVREIMTLGPVSAVPGAPARLAGATSHRGGVLPVLVPEDGESRPRAGDPAIVVEVGDVLAALATEGIGEVATLRESSADGQLIDAAGHPVELVQPGELIDSAILAIADSRRFPEAS